MDFDNNAVKSEACDATNQSLIMSPTDLLQIDINVSGSREHQNNYVEVCDEDVSESSQIVPECFLEVSHDALVQDDWTKSDFTVLEKDGLYYCKCSKTFKRRTSAMGCMKQHANEAMHSEKLEQPARISVSTFKGKKLLACGECGYATKILDNLKQHKLIHTSDQPFACNLCSYITSRLYTLERHKRTHSDDKKFSCTECNYTTKFYNTLKKHELTHTGEKPFACHELSCQYTTKILSELKQHRTAHIGNNDLMVCVECDYATKEASNLKRHKITHRKFPGFKGDVSIDKKLTKPYGCDSCSFRFSRAESLEVHKKVHSGRKPYECDECNYSCIQSHAFKRHKRVHTGEKPFSCEDCTYTCVDFGDLRKHRMIHTTDRPFTCDQCNYSGLQLGDLKRHKLTHSTNKPFSCEECGFRCIRADYLKIHKQMHSKPFACDECDYICTQLIHLRTHKMKHSGERPYPCEECSYSSRTVKHLKRHKLTHEKQRMLSAAISADQTVQRFSTQSDKITDSEPSIDKLESPSQNTEITANGQVNVMVASIVKV